MMEETSIGDAASTPLSESLQYILENYAESRDSRRAQSGPVVDRFRRISDELRDLPFVQKHHQRTESRVLSPEWSVGQGNWTFLPWIAVLDRRETDTVQEGIYCVFLFAEDMSRVYWTFNQGVTRLTEERGTRKGRRILRERADRFHEHFPQLAQRGFQTDEGIDLQTDRKRGRDYEHSTIAYKEYRRDDIPPDEEIVDDVEHLLTIYEAYVEGPDFSFDDEKMSDLRERFLQRFPDFDGFQPAEGLYADQERNYKDELRELYQEKLVTLLEKTPTDQEDHDQLVENTVAILSTRLQASGETQNLLNYRYYDFLRNLDADNERRTFSTAFRSLLGGDGPLPQRAESFVDTLISLLPGRDSTTNALTRSFPTLFLWLADPNQAIYIRSSSFKSVAKEVTGDPLFANRPLDAVEFIKSQAFARAFEGHLHEWGWQPRDLIDVQGFIWIADTYADPYHRSHWIFQGNPDYFDVEGYARSRDEIRWTVQQHQGEIEPPDRVYLWESGGDAGIVAVCRVISTVEDMPSDESAAEFIRSEPERFQGVRPRVRLHVEQVLDEPLARSRLQEQDGLEELSILKGPRGTNFNVSKEEAKLIDQLLGEHRPRTILKVAPGKESHLWDECLEDGLIRVGYPGVGNLKEYESEEELKAAFREHYFENSEGTASQYAEAFWKFRDLSPGDWVVANDGYSTVLGVGRVQEPGYLWDSDRGDYPNAVHVEWDTDPAGTIPDQGGAWRSTIVEIDHELFDKIMNGFPDDEEREEREFDELLEELEEEGFHFPPELVTNYLLALQAKRFVILTGISGTGKTRLAMEAAQFLQPEVTQEQVIEEPDDAVEVEVHPYMLDYAQLVVPVAMSRRIRALNESEENRIQIPVEYPEGETELTLSRETGRDTSYLSFRGEFRKWFQDSFEVGDLFYLSLELEEDSEEEYLRLVRPRTTTTVDRLNNYAVVDVHPDWTDNRGLLGYYNPITEQYQPTRFLTLLLRAREEEERAKEQGRQPYPFFVVLDEMNLARVEHYFSDFLSALESEEPIRLHNDRTLEQGEVAEGPAIPRELKVPNNVFFTGTVNVDETTYMFSPKVLDRAFTLELNRVDLRGYSGDETGFEAEEGDLLINELDTPLRFEERPDEEDWQAFGELQDGDLQDLIVRLNDLLNEDNRHFGYRVANEIARFVLLATEQAEGSGSAAWAALDIAVMEKVLPKFHGTQQELESTLTKLFMFSVTGGDGNLDKDATDGGWTEERGRLVYAEGEDEKGNSPEPVLPRTGAKVWRMLRRLRQQGFTSFIQ